VWVKSNQYTEKEWLENCDGDQQLKEFIKLLGPTIELKGWKRFNGGLDTANDLTGKYSIYTDFENNSIMFHVSTMLPYRSDMPAMQLDRKRHIGNDIVVIIFLSDDAVFDPSTIRSSVNNIWLVIREAKTQYAEKYYQISVVTKGSIPSFSPYFEYPAIYQKSESFRKLILTKCVNGENAAKRAPIFKSRINKAREVLLETLVDAFLKKQK